MSRIPVILNPVAGGGRLLRQRDRLTAGAAALGSELDIWIAASPSDTIELARKAAANRLPLVLAYGGDGTYNAVARGLLGSDTAMGVLPGGTTSVLAYEFDVPRPAQRAIEALLRAREQGMIHHVGFSTHIAAVGVEAVQRFPFEVVLVILNLLNQATLEELIPLCRQKGVGVTIMKPVATGLLPGLPIGPQLIVLVSLL